MRGITTGIVALSCVASRPFLVTSSLKPRGIHIKAPSTPAIPNNMLFRLTKNPTSPLGPCFFPLSFRNSHHVRQSPTSAGSLFCFVSRTRLIAYFLPPLSYLHAQPISTNVVQQQLHRLAFLPNSPASVSFSDLSEQFVDSYLVLVFFVFHSVPLKLKLLLIRSSTERYPSLSSPQRCLSTFLCPIGLPLQWAPLPRP